MSIHGPPGKKSYRHRPDGWNAGYLAAKADIVTTPLRVLCLGDSITAGVAPATSVKTSIWPSKLRDLWLAKYPDAALRAVYWHNSGPSYGYPDGPFSAALNLHTFGSVNTGWMGSDKLNSTASPIDDWGQRFTGTRAATALDLYWFMNYPGTWSFNVDRDDPGHSFTYDIGSGSTAGTTGADITVTSTGSGTTSDNTTDRVLRITIDGLSSAVHTIDIGKQSAQYYVAGTVGAAEYPTGRTGGGVKWASIGVSAHAGSEFDKFDYSVYPRDQAALIGQGVSPQAYGGTGAGVFGWPTGPHLLIVALGVNDNLDVVANPPDKYARGLGRIIHAARRATPDCSVILVAQPLPNPDYSDVDISGGGYTSTEYWPQYLGALYDVANTHQAAVVNLHAKWGATPGAQGLMTNNIHWLDAGHADLAALVCSIL